MEPLNLKKLQILLKMFNAEVLPSQIILKDELIK